MENIFHYLENNKIEIGLTRYPENDYASGVEITAIVQNYQLLIDYYNNLDNFNIKSFEDYNAYMFLYKIIEYEKYVDIVADDKKAVFIQTINLLKILLDKYNKKAVFIYLNDNIKMISQYENNETFNDIDLKIETINYCLKYKSAISKNTWEHLINNHSCLLMDNFKEFINVLKKEKNLIDLFFSKKNLNTVLEYRLDEIFNILITLQKQEWFKKTFNKSILIITEFIDQKISDLKIEDAIISQTYVSKLYYFLDTIKSKKAKECFNKLEEQNKLLNEYLSIHGQKFSYEISIKDYVELIEKSTKDNKAKTILIYLTHYCDNKIFTHFFDQLIKNYKSGLTDFCSTNIKTNDFFTLGVQNDLGMEIQYHILKMNYILNSEIYTELLFKEVLKLLNSTFDYFGIDKEKNELVDSLELLFSLVVNYVNILKDEEKEKYKHYNQSLAYSIEMYTCGLIEKILRLIYKSIIDEESYINENSLSLGFLLDINNEVIKNLIGINHIRLLRFFLINDDNEVGEGIRNNLAHLKNIENKEFNYINVEKVLVLFFGVVTTIVLSLKKPNSFIV